MASELRRVAQGLVDTLNEVPGVVAHLQRTAARCRENAALVMQLAGSRGSMAAQQLDAAARACDAAAHYLSMAPPKARGWAEGLVNMTPDAGGRPGAGSADRNPLTTSGPGPGGDRSAGRGDPPREPRTADVDGPESERKGECPPRAADWAEIDLKLFKQLPVRAKPTDPTHGILIGNGPDPQYIRSGRDGPAAGGPGLSGRHRRMNSALDHVEGHVAALLRRAGASGGVTLYINNRPCPGEMGCYAILEDLLPVGTNLTLYWPESDGLKSDVFRGNGKGLA